MPLRVELYGDEHTEVVHAFNARLDAGGVDPGFRLSDDPGPNLPPPVAKNTFLLLDGEDVRGAYMLQEQLFHANGQTVCTGNIQLPLSEGLIDRKYSSVSTVLLKHVQKEQPLLFAVGMGSADQPWPRLIQAMGWKVRPVPFFFRVLRGGAFFRHIRPLRTTPARRLLFNLAAATGVGHRGMQAFHAFRSERGKGKVEARRVTQWGEWVNEIWVAARDQSSLIGVRDAGTLPALYPPSERHLCYQLREKDKPVGWTVLLSTPMKNHKQFGDMRVGTILDCMTLPGYETAGLRAATDALAAAGADIAVANHTHQGQQAAFRRNGYLEGPSNFLLGTSKELTNRIGEAEGQIWFTRGDGDGRLNL